MARWWPMEKLERSGRLVDHAVALAEPARVRGPGHRDRRRVRREHDGRHGRPVARRARARSAAYDHSPAEYLEVASIVPADGAASPALLLAIGRDPVVAGWRAADRSCAERRRLISSGGPWEASVGYSRAVVVGDVVLGRRARPTRARTAARCIPATPPPRREPRGRSSRRRSPTAGFALADVVRTRMYVVSIEDAPAVSAVHGELFGDDPTGRDARPGRRR